MNHSSKIIKCLELNLLNANSMSFGEQIVIGGVPFTASKYEEPIFLNFKLSNDSTPAHNIAETAKSLVRVINESRMFVAHYASRKNDLPGRILLEEIKNPTFT